MRNDPSMWGLCSRKSSLECRFFSPQTGLQRPDRSPSKENPEMKKLTSALALVALATSLVACSKPEDKKPEVKVEAPKVVEETSKTTTTSTTSTAPDATPATTVST